MRTKAKKSTRIKYPIESWQREMLLDVIQVLESKPYASCTADKLEALIQELQSYLPEIQLGSDEYVSRIGFFGERKVMKRVPTRPLTEVIDIAERFDDMHCEIMLIRYRAYAANRY